jgi:spermidine synthase
LTTPKSDRNITALTARLLPLALVFSGFAALAVEVLWLRLLSRLLGGSAQAIAAILVAYMGGLALGSALAARRADRLDRRGCLRTYVRLELLIWAVSSALTLLLGELPVAFGGWLAGVPEGTPRFLVRLGGSVLVLLVPTIAMGATLPLAVRAWGGGSRSSFLRGTALLYAANTLGAVLGALAAPFALMPLGVRAGALVAATASLVAAGIARLIIPSAGDEAAPTEDDDARPPSRVSLPPMAALALFSGVATLGLEVLWTRWLTPLAGTSTHSFGMVLALVLVGIVLGSTIVFFAGRRVEEATSLAGLLAILGALLAAALMGLIDGIPVRFVELADADRLDVRSSLATLLGVAAIAIVPAMVCFGAVLPLVARSVRTSGDDAARAVGLVYSANTVGALLASGLTALVLVPRFGLNGTVAALLAPVIATGAGVVVVGAATRSRRWLALAVGAAALAAVALARPPIATRRAAAMYKPQREGVGLERVLYYREGPEGPVLVEASSANRTFYVSGRSEASDSWLDVRTQYLIGHLPALMAGGAKTSLVIGLGSGMTAGALLRHGQVTIAELNPVVPGATRFFDHRNHRVLDKARLKIEDGRVALLEPGESFDLVTTDPIHPGVAGSGSLYTVEHFRLCRSRLNPGGVVSLWVPLYQMGREELRGIVGAFVEVFPGADLWISQYQAILVGGGRPRDGAEALRLIRAGWTEDVAGDMLAGLIESPEVLAVSRVAGPDDLRRYAGGARLVRDDDPWIELTLPRYLYRYPLDGNIGDLMRLRTEKAPDPELVAPFDAVQRAHLLTSSGENALAVKALESTLVLGRSPFLEHSALLRLASASLVGGLARQGQRPAAVERLRAEAAHPEATLDSLVRSWEMAMEIGERQVPEGIEGRLRERWPDRPEGHYLAAYRLIEEDRFDEVFTHAMRAAQMTDYPGYVPKALGLAGRARVGLGDVAGGLVLVQQALALNPDLLDLRELRRALTAPMASGGL